MNVKQHWPVKTFASETEKNYDIAISYYKQKRIAFMSFAQQQVIQKMAQFTSQTQSIQELVNQNVEYFSQNILPAWQSIQQSKKSIGQLQSGLKKWKQNTQDINTAISRIQGISTLLNSINPTFPINAIKDGPSFIDQNILTRWIEKTPMKGSSYSGARASAFGEIFESLFTSCLAQGVSDNLQVLKIGSYSTSRSPTSGSKVQGKTDVMMNAGPSLSLATDSTGLTIGKTSTGLSVLLDANEWIDISNGSKYFMNQYVKGPAQALVGVSVKQWLMSEVAHKSGSSSKASMGSSSWTARLIESRWSPLGLKTISWVFDNPLSFTSYTGYIVSKYLVNIIGAYNILMITGDEIAYTEEWLRSLLDRQYVIAHMFRQGQVGKGTVSNAYYVKPGLVVAYKGEY